jgi:hypothetical protein
MVIPNQSHDHGLEDRGVAGQSLPDCGEHQGTCARCGVELKIKPRKRFKGEARRTRSTISLKVPKDADEDGAAVFDELIEQARELLGEPDKPIYYILVAALYVFVRDFRAEDAE